jgi:hypothetical protein
VVNDFHDKHGASARTAPTESQKRRAAEIEEREKREAEERQKRESEEEEERCRRAEREEAERRRIEEREKREAEERQKRESEEEEERRRRAEREEAERRRIEEEEAARRERDSTQTQRNEGVSRVETAPEGDDGPGTSVTLAEKKRQAAEFARKEAEKADKTRLQTYEWIEATPSEVQLTKKGQPSCCTIA